MASTNPKFAFDEQIHSLNRPSKELILRNVLVPIFVHLRDIFYEEEGFALRRRNSRENHDRSWMEDPLDTQLAAMASFQLPEYTKYF